MEDFQINKKKQENLVKKFDDNLKKILANPHVDHIHIEAKPLTREDMERVMKALHDS